MPLPFPNSRRRASTACLRFKSKRRRGTTACLRPKSKRRRPTTATFFQNEAFVGLRRLLFFPDGPFVGLRRLLFAPDGPVVGLRCLFLAPWHAVEALQHPYAPSGLSPAAPHGLAGKPRRPYAWHFRPLSDAGGGASLQGRAARHSIPLAALRSSAKTVKKRRKREVFLVSL